MFALFAGEPGLLSLQLTAVLHKPSDVAQAKAVTLVMS